MPQYNTKCLSCAKTNELRLSFSNYDAVRLGTKTLECTACQGQVDFVFCPGDVSFVLRDGESGGWISKSMRENKYRANRVGVMERRQRDHAPNPKLTPNFAGEVTHTWADAKQAAYDKALGETQDHSAAREASKTYDSFVNKESSVT